MTIVSPMLTDTLNSMKEIILNISHEFKLSHLGSNFSTLPILHEIFSLKNSNDIVILSSGHAAISLYAVMEKYLKISARHLYLKHGCHPHLDEENGIYCSTGSLGMGITVAVGRALANKNRNVYCVLSDGECSEGSVWEALQLIKLKNITNLKVYVNINGYCAYDAVDKDYLSQRLVTFLPSINIRYTEVNAFPFLNGLNAHYHIMSDDDYANALKLL